MRWLLLLLLVACEPVAKDEKLIRVDFVKDTTAVRAKCGSTPLEPYGCAKDRGTSCDIVVIKPRGFDDHEAVKTLGHELLHCYWGPIHR